MIISTDKQQIKRANGQTRVITRFAFLPVFIKDSYVLWERYNVLQAYFYTEYSAIVNGEKQIFPIGRWQDLAKSIRKKVITVKTED